MVSAIFGNSRSQSPADITMISDRAALKQPRNYEICLGKMARVVHVCFVQNYKINST